MGHLAIEARVDVVIHVEKKAKYISYTEILQEIGIILGVFTILKPLYK